MENYTIPENPQYTTEIRKLENTDPANAEAILNPLIETLIENTHAVKQKADSIEVLQERMDSQQAELSGKADNKHQHDVGDISSGILSIARGGTGGSTVAEVRNNLGLGNTSGAVPIANGGTGQTTAAGARNALGLGNTTGALPVANGGTGGTTGSAACTNIGALSKSGGTMTGILYAQSNTSYTAAQARNISASTSDLTAGTSTLANGAIHLVYE